MQLSDVTDHRGLRRGDRQPPADLCNRSATSVGQHQATLACIHLLVTMREKSGP